MVTGWRRAFCTSIPKEREPKIATEKPPPQPSHNSTTPVATPTNTTTATATAPASNHRSPRFGSKFIFFSSSSSSTTTTTTPAGSNSSTPRLQTPPVSSPSLRCRTTASVSVPPSTTPSPLQDSTTPRLQCKTGKSPRFFHRNSNPSSPRSPSTFSLIKNTLRISKTRCGICVQSIKAGQGTAIFTAECSHTFHFPCIASHVGKNGGLVCPVCGSNWKELPLLAVQKYAKSSQDNKAFSAMKISDLKVYNDDESLLSSPSGARFNPIPESDEHDEDGKSESESGTEEFQGFFVNNPTIVTTPRSARSLIQEMNNRRDIEVRISHEAAVVAVGRSYETYAVVVKIRAPPPPSNLSRRPPVDLVAVLDVGGGITFSRLQMIKRTMRLVISSLSSIDRLSIVAFSANSKRLLPFRRMTSTGRRSARRITDALICSQGSCVNDALRKAAKVIQDRREKNPATSIILLSDGPDEKASNANQRSRQFPFVSSTRYSPLEIPVHWLNIGAYESSSHGRDQLAEDDLTKSIGGLLSVVVSDLRLQIGFSTGSATAEISGVYSCTGRPGLLRAGSAKLGDMYAEEEREILLELKAPSTATGTHHFLTVRSSCKDPATQELINGKEHAFIVPRPHTIRSSDPSIQRLRSLFVVTRAVAESRRLIDRKDFNGAHHLLSSARALLMQRNNDGSADCYLRSIEAEMAELHWRRQMEMQQQDQGRRVGAREKEMTFIDEKGQPLTPTSAWKAAEKLAKVAVMRKSMNRVSDLHGFENARF